jgi:predicted RNA binding protein YcfA (HicA-like mRNA interferase family)
MCRNATTNIGVFAADSGAAIALRRRQTGAVKISAVLQMPKDDGWYLVATRGSHRQYKHASKPGRVTVPGRPSDDLAPGTMNSILKNPCATL